MQSFDYFPLIGKTTFSLAAYKSILTNDTFLTSLGFTAYYSIVVTVFSMVFAVIISMALRKTFRAQKIVVFFYQLNLPIPHIVAATAIIMLFSQTGLTSRLLYSLGIINDAQAFPIMVYDKRGIGVILSLLWKFIPFIGVAVLGLLQSMGADYEIQAMSLGATPWKKFTNVLLPLMFPSIQANSILCFAYAFGVFEVPFLLSGTYPVSTSVLIYQKYNNIDLNSRPEAMAMAMILTIVILFAIVLYQRAAKRSH
jgi:putative spermidine/putrescine transport system permease protein